MAKVPNTFLILALFCMALLAITEGTRDIVSKTGNHEYDRKDENYGEGEGEVDKEEVLKKWWWVKESKWAKGYSIWSKGKGKGDHSKCDEDEYKSGLEDGDKCEPDEGKEDKSEEGDHKSKSEKEKSDEHKADDGEKHKYGEGDKYKCDDDSKKSKPEEGENCKHEEDEKHKSEERDKSKHDEGNKSKSEEGKKP